MSVEIVEIVAVTFVVWIVVALFVAARAKRRREAEAAATDASMVFGTDAKRVCLGRKEPGSTRRKVGGISSGESY
jgi:hypothetical protein